MRVKFRNYKGKSGITEDYFKVRDFLVKQGYSEFTYARFDWMITHGCLNEAVLEKIGIWEDDNNIVGIAIVDCNFGTAYCLNKVGYDNLKEEMLVYAQKNLGDNNTFKVMIRDNDIYFQDVACKLGFTATKEREEDKVFYLDKTSTEYKLPEGFSITTMKEDFNLYQYAKVLWRGFNHELKGEGPLPYTKDYEEQCRRAMIRPNVNLDLKVAIRNSEGDFVSYCGMWYDKEAGFAVIEPVATDPDYRNLGLGKAVVLEGIRRVGLLGATKAVVGSSNEFYYNIGLRPYSTASAWVKRK